MMQDLSNRDSTALTKLQPGGSSFSRCPDTCGILTSSSRASLASSHHPPFSGMRVCGQDPNQTLLRTPFGSLFLHFLTHIPSFTSCGLFFLHPHFLEFLILKESSNALLGTNWYLFLRKKPIEAMQLLKKGKRQASIGHSSLPMPQFYRSCPLAILDKRCHLHSN